MCCELALGQYAGGRAHGWVVGWVTGGVPADAANLLFPLVPLAASLVSMFALTLVKAAVVVPLPPERRPAGGGRLTWSVVNNLVQALSLQVLIAGWRVYLAAAEQPAAGGFSGRTRRLLQASCQLLVAAPLEAAEDLQPSQVTTLLLGLMQQLDTAASVMIEECRSWPRGSLQHRLQPARLLAQVMARLPGVLRAASGGLQQVSDVRGDTAVVFSLCNHPAGLLAALLSGGNGGGYSCSLVQSAADLPLWCNAARGALCIAPLAAEALGEADGALGLPVAQQLDVLASGLLALCLRFVEAGFNAVEQGAAPAGSTLAAAEVALWNVHSAACRRIHAAARRADDGAAALPGVLAKALTLSMACAATLESWVAAIRAGSGKR